MADALEENITIMKTVIDSEPTLEDKLVDIILWMSGSPSFSPGGVAHEGFKKLAVPVLDQYFAKRNIKN